MHELIVSGTQAWSTEDPENRVDLSNFEGWTYRSERPEYRASYTKNDHRRDQVFAVDLPLTEASLTALTHLLCVAKNTGVRIDTY